MKIILIITLILCFTLAQGDLLPIYRYWNPSIQDHFYETNFHELGQSKHGWHLEGTIGYAYTSHVQGTVPLYRYWNPQLRDHFYETNYNELGQGRHGWHLERIIGYVFQHQHHGTSPLYRYWNPHAHDHFYTTNFHELGHGRHGWHLERVIGFVYVSKPHHFMGSCERHGLSSLRSYIPTTNKGLLKQHLTGYRGHNFLIKRCILETPSEALVNQVEWGLKHYPMQGNQETDDVVHTILSRFAQNTYLAVTDQCDFQYHGIHSDQYKFLISCDVPSNQPLVLRVDTEIYVSRRTKVIGSKIGSKRTVPASTDMIRVDGSFFICVNGHSDVGHLLDGIDHFYRQSGGHLRTLLDKSGFGNKMSIARFIQTLLCRQLDMRVRSTWSPWIQRYPTLMGSGRHEKRLHGTGVHCEDRIIGYVGKALGFLGFKKVAKYARFCVGFETKIVATGSFHCSDVTRKSSCQLRVDISLKGSLGVGPHVHTESRHIKTLTRSAH